MLYYKFGHGKWFESRSKSSAYIVYRLSYISSHAPLASFAKYETQKVAQIFSRKIGA